MSELKHRLAAILAADASVRALQTEIQASLARRNEASKLIGQALAQGDKDKAEALKAEVADLKTALPAQEEAEREQLAALHTAVTGTSPVGHTLARAVPVQIDLAWTVLFVAVVFAQRFVAALA